jgi:2-oxoglutarate dehydrogenase E2 component (dihydrolipoamide succinyltransferase)
MGESIVEGTLTKWLKKQGEHVERDEPLFEISTEKVDTEIPSPAAGTLSEVLVQEGATVSINTVVARIQDGANGAAAPQPKAAQTEPKAAAPQPKAAPTEPKAAPTEPKAAPAKPTPAPPPQLEAPPERAEEAVSSEAAGPISPLVRRMAREHNLDLSQIRGTGAGGRVTKQDVEAYLAQQAAPPSKPAPAPPPPPQPAAAAPAPTPAQAPIPMPTQAKTRIEPMSTMRIKIAEHMRLSKQTSAHVTTIHRIDMTKVAKLRERQKSDVQARYGFSLTYLPFITRAVIVALRQYPLVNASVDGNNIIYHNEINVGIAVALENGLIVPVIRGADEKNVLGLQHSIVDLATRARSRQLKPDEVQGGTFSITNFGSFGSVIGTPIINQPQVAILGVGTVDKTPVVLDDAIAIRSICYLSLSFDHRLIDGALADQFMTRVKQVLEDWSEDVL